MMDKLIKIRDDAIIRKNEIVAIWLEKYGRRRPKFHFYLKSGFIIESMEFSSSKDALGWLKTVLPEYAEKFEKKEKEVW